MSQALTQNATDLTPSLPEEWILAVVINRLSIRAIKNPDRSATKAKFQLNWNKLVNAVRDDWKLTHGQVNRVPDEVDKEIQTGVTGYIQEHLNYIHAGNVRTLNVRDVHDSKNHSIKERVTATGENIRSQKDQLIGCSRLIHVCQDKIEKYEKFLASGNSQKDYTDLLKRAKDELASLRVTHNFIKATIAETQKAVESKPATE